MLRDFLMLSMPYLNRWQKEEEEEEEDRKRMAEVCLSSNPGMK